MSELGYKAIRLAVIAVLVLFGYLAAYNIADRLGPVRPKEWVGTNYSWPAGVKP